MTEASNVPENCHEMSPADAETTVTITFDFSSGIIQKAMSLNVAEISRTDARNLALDGVPLFYMTK